VHREGREREEKKEDLLAKSAYKKYMIYVNILYHSSMDVSLERG
jgi:hypothetical protein